MQPSELELYSTGELIHELMRRRTFLGVVVHSDEEHKSPTWSGERLFQVHFNTNLDRAEVGRLLDVVAEHVGRSAS